MDFIIDERLSINSALVGEGPLSSIFLKNNAAYSWIVLVPRVVNIAELYELNSDQQMLLFQEINKVSRLLKADDNKINVASLGNIVRQLHIHIVARNQHDPAWPHAIWQAELMTTPYSDDAWQEIQDTFRLKLL